MKLTHRLALVIKPKGPFLTWANALDDDGPHLSLADVQQDGTTYLLEKDWADDVDHFLEHYHPLLFAHELASWHTDERAWPEARDLATFGAWFDVEVHSMVFDVVRGKERCPS